MIAARGWCVNIVDIVSFLILAEYSVAVAHTVRAMSEFSADVTKSSATQLVPLAFLAMHASPTADGDLHACTHTHTHMHTWCVSCFHF